MPKPQNRSPLETIGRELRRVPRNLEKFLRRPGSGFASRYGILQSLDFFNDGGVRWGRGAVPLTLANANGFAPALVDLIDALDETATRLPPQDGLLRDASEAKGNAEFADELKRLFTRYGSDKPSHNYHLIYAEVLEKLGRDKPLALLEIGINVTAANRASAIEDAGKPGASLRAWRDALPNAQIYGAEIDRAMLFSDTRIKTAFVDQTRPETFAAMCQDLGCDSFDLIVDDGLHSIYGCIYTLIFGLRHLRPGHCIFIEDIWPHQMAPWHAVLALLQRHKIPCGFWKCNKRHLFWAQKPLSQ